MKKVVLSFGIWILAAVSYKALAQPNDGKKESKEIIIKSSGSEVDMRVQIKDGEVFINGKPIKDFTSDSLKLIVRELNISDGTNFSFNGNVFFDNTPTRRTFLGVSTEENSSEGLTVKSVVKDGPAEKSGLKPNDILLSFNGTDLKTPQQLYELVTKQKQGDKVKVIYKRDGKKKNVTVSLGEKVEEVKTFVWSDNNKNKKMTIVPSPPMPPTPPRAPSIEFENWGEGYTFRSSKPKLGLTIQDTENGDGVKVIKVDEESTAFKGGARPDDMIIEIDGKAVKNTDQAREALSIANKKNTYDIKVMRNGSPVTIKINIPKKLKTVDL